MNFSESETGSEEDVTGKPVAFGTAVGEPHESRTVREVHMLGSEEKWYGTYTDKPDGSWNQAAENMMANFSGSGNPIFRSFSVFERGELRSNGGGKKSIHFNGSHENIELLLHTVMSANQLSVYGAIAELCNDAPKRS